MIAANALRRQWAKMPDPLSRSANFYAYNILQNVVGFQSERNSHTPAPRIQPTCNRMPEPTNRRINRHTTASQLYLSNIIDLKYSISSFEIPHSDFRYATMRSVHVAFSPPYLENPSSR